MRKRSVSWEQTTVTPLQFLQGPTLQQFQFSLSEGKGALTAWANVWSQEAVLGRKGQGTGF